jgi:serine/threonine-protein kinase HipA
VKKPPLNVFADDRLVGQIARSDVEEDGLLFTYRTDCPAAQAVSLTMPVRTDPYDSMSGLLPIFDMNLPEGALREQLRIQFAKTIPGFDDLDLLQIVGSSQIGRLRFTIEEKPGAAGAGEDLRQILTYKGSQDLFADLLQRYATSSGVSGVQPKVLIRDRSADAAMDRLTHRGATHIVKSFDAAAYPELAANEFLCLQGAMSCGIACARARLSDNRRLLVVDRFDLTQEGYLGIEDFCVLNALRAAGRYEGSYEDIARRLNEYLSPQHLSRGLEQFALQVAFSCTIGNGDAHLKNFSVLYRDADSEVSLAPAYDLVSTVPYFPRDTLALTMDDSKEFPDRQRLLKFVRKVTGKSPAAAAKVLAQVRKGAQATMQGAQRYAAENPEAERFAQSLTTVVQQGIERLGR